MSYSMHDFHIHHSDKSKEELISFDLMVPEDFQGSPNKLKDYIKSEIRKSEPDLDVDIYVDRIGFWESTYRDNVRCAFNNADSERI